jgi:hypothetical protein
MSRNWQIGRRTFLKGVGAAIALPMLDAMAPARLGRVALGATEQAATEAARRLAFIYVPNGIVMNNWTPATEGAGFEYTRILKPIEAFKDRTMILTGLNNYMADAMGDGGGDHARAGAAYYTCTHPKKTGGSDIFAGVSVDQVLAQKIGGNTRLPSLEIGLDDNRTVGHCDSGYSCAYTNSLSWKSPTVPLPPEASPRLLFERMYGDIDTSIDAATRARRAMYRNSILDMTRDETSRLESSLGAADKHKIDEYLSTIREVEKRIQAIESGDQKAPVPTIEKPAGIPAEFTDHAKIMYDLQVLAMQQDLSRIITFVVGREGSVRTYEQIGIPDPHHPLSHHRNNPVSLEKLTQINTYHMQLFAYFLDKLSKTPDGDGMLLDHSTILYGCGHSDSNRHLHTNLPVVMIDGFKKDLTGGKHIKAAPETPLANLYLTIMDRMGVHHDSFGDSTGRLDV